MSAASFGGPSTAPGSTSAINVSAPTWSGSMPPSGAPYFNAGLLITAIQLLVQTINSNTQDILELIDGP